jgi:hypothetical protein
MADYKTNAQEVFAALGKDPEKAAKLLLDVIDEKIEGGVLEPIEDALKVALASYLAQLIARVQTEAGAYAKLFGDLADDPTAAVTFLLAKGDELINGGAMEPMIDGLAAVAQPFLIEGLSGLQEKLAAAEIAAES